MKKTYTIFLQAIIILIGIGVLVFMLWEPHIEGRNIQATTYEIYFNDPFLAYAYAASIAFFTALFQAFKLLGYIGNNQLLSPKSARALRIIKLCAMSLIVFIATPVAYLFIARPGDDIAGGVAIGLFLLLVSTLIAVTTSILEKRLQAAIMEK